MSSVTMSSVTMSTDDQSKILEKYPYFIAINDGKKLKCIYTNHELKADEATVKAFIGSKNFLKKKARQDIMQGEYSKFLIPV